ncbi:branched-chain amino acid transport system II carrier protein, partial [Gleimia europaea]|nr:branched-chain amino acid transport system II carrier protein [Gleimia europaea]
MRNSRTYVLVVTGMALFAMFFGAGNLIFPVMIGVDAGVSFTPAILGFLG